jgi:transcriptional regulator with XRE-family HTH domain
MAKHSKTTFVFGPEIRARLRQLRKRRGLSLRTLAVLMDRPGRGAHVQLARLERGDVEYPSMNLVADYLQACGAGFEDLLDLLKAHTSKPPALTQKGDAAVAELLKSLPTPEQRAMLKWEKATFEKREERAAAAPLMKKPRVETDRQRIFRIVWSFIHANWNEVFEQKLYETMLKLKSEVRTSQRKHACRHARRFFGILTRYYKHEARRQSALERVKRRAKEDGVTEPVVALLLKAATDAHRELEQAGRLDWQPTQEEIIKRRGHAPKVEKAETRMEMDALAPVLARNRAEALVQAMVQGAVCTRLEKLHLDFETQRYYIWWIQRLVPIGAEHGTDSREWQADVEATVPKMHDPALARSVAEQIAEVFNRWKVRIPPKPSATI